MIKEVMLCYGRVGTIEIIKSADCDICHQTGLCMVVDVADGEYGRISICEACTMILFVQEKVEDLKKMPYYTEDKEIPDYGPPVNEDDIANRVGCPGR